jgi:hypothetical protein
MSVILFVKTVPGSLPELQMKLKTACNLERGKHNPDFILIFYKDTSFPFRNVHRL